LRSSVIPWHIGGGAEVASRAKVRWFPVEGRSPMAAHLSTAKPRNPRPIRSASASRPPNTRAAATNKPRRMVISGWTALGRRIRDLADSYAVPLGGWGALTDMQAAAVRRAAELMAIAEQTRANALRDGCADPVALARLEGCADRAVRRLRLDQIPEKVPSLRELGL
jgi:hypothetical protein